MAKQNIAEDNSTPTGANKFSVYAKRNAASRVDWGTIAGDISTEIKTIDDERKELKAVIAEDTAIAFKEIAAVGDLNGVRLNEEVIEASNQSSEVLRIAYRNLKSGAISPTQYKMIMQRQKNNYSELSSAAKNYSTWFTEQQKRNAVEGGSNLEMTIGNGTAGFGNLDNKKFWVDPLSGSIMLVTMQEDDDGNIFMPNFKDNPEFFQNISAINNRYNFKEDRKILSEETAALVDPLKETVISTVSRLTALEGGGVVTSTKDLRNDKDFDQIIVDNVGSLTATGNDVAQILTGQKIGDGYQLAESLDEFNRKYPDLDDEYFIKYVMENGVGVAKPTDAQTKVAKERAERSLESQIDSIVKQTGPKAAQQENVNRGGDKANETMSKNLGYIKEIDTMLNGSTADSQATLDRVVTEHNQRDKDTGKGNDQIDSYSIDGDFITLSYTNKSGKPDLVLNRRSENIVNGVRVEDNPETEVNESFTNVKPSVEALSLMSSLFEVRMTMDDLDKAIEYNAGAGTPFEYGNPNPESRGVIIAKGAIPEFKLDSVAGGTLLVDNKPATVNEYLQEEIDDSTMYNLSTTVANTVKEALVLGLDPRLLSALGSGAGDNIRNSVQFRRGINGADSFVIFKLADKTYEINVGGPTTNIKTKDIANQLEEAINEAITTVNVKRLDTEYKPNDQFTFATYREAMGQPELSYKEFQKAKKTRFKDYNEKTEAQKNKDKSKM